MAEARVHALLPAAGRGQRFGDALLKQYAPVAGEPVLTHALRAVTLGPPISGVTVVLADDDQQFDRLIAPHFPGVRRVSGGPTRAESVLRGLRSIKDTDPAADWVLVHDAARPCLPGSCLRRLLRQGLASPDGALLAVPVRDTLKRDDGEDHVAETVRRSGLWMAQTPQLFPLARLVEALEAALAAGEAPTDEAQAMEAQGARPLLVRGSAVNVKITYPGDLELVASWLAAKSEGAR